MSSRTPVERHARFLDHGFYAPELPPCFATRGFGAAAPAIMRNIRALTPTGARAAHLRYVADKITFYFPRFNNSDRLHSVINPVSYLFISDLISRNYKKLRVLEERSKYSLSPSVFDWSGTRAIRRPVFGKRDEFVSQLSPRFEYTVSADIRSFYHSIYTHAIPWAIHGKPAAKRNRGLQHLGNELDMLVRNAQGGQTVGLPVGPDTSRILAEVLVSAVDVEIDRHLRLKEGDASRFVDDYTVGCNSVSEGQRIVAQIRRAVSLFELDIGNEKTVIEPTNHLAYVGWQEHLQGFVPGKAQGWFPRLPVSGPKPAKPEFDRFFYVVHEMAKQHPRLNVERFAMQVCRKAFRDCDEWKFLQDHMVSSYRRNPTLVESLVETLVLRHEERKDLDLGSLRDFVSSRLPVLVAHQRTGEIVWLLYLCCRVGLRLPGRTLAETIQTPNALVAVLFWTMVQSGLAEGSVDLKPLAGFCTEDGLRGDMWLFAYEAARREWSENGRAYCEDDDFYGPFIERDVSFFDIANGPKELSEVLHRRKRENTITRLLMKSAPETGWDWEEDGDVPEFATDDDDGYF